MRNAMHGESLRLPREVRSWAATTPQSLPSHSAELAIPCCSGRLLDHGSERATSGGYIADEIRQQALL
jgi:hypothetical protein